MVRKLGVLTFIVLFGVAAAASAAQAKPQAKPAATKAARPTTLIASGKVVKFDGASNMLTVSTPKGQEQFMLGSSSRITEGKKNVAASDLGSFSDRQVQVRYTESDGHKMVSSLRIEAGPKTATTRTTTTKSKKND